MKSALPGKIKSANTPAPISPPHGSASSDHERAPLALIPPATNAPLREQPYKSFDGDPKADAKALLQTLEFELAKYPQFTAILTLSIEPLKAEVRRKPKSDRDLVFDVLATFDSVALEELLDDTHLPVARVCAALLNLIEVGLADCRTSGKRAGTKLDPNVKAMLEQIFARPDHRHLKRDLRAEYLFCLTHVPAGSNYTGPQRQFSATKSMMSALED